MTETIRLKHSYLLSPLLLSLRAEIDTGSPFIFQQSWFRETMNNTAKSFVILAQKEDFSSGTLYSILWFVRWSSLEGDVAPWALAQPLEPTSGICI